ncbi:MAG: M56 family metallopeptidase [Vicinamibacteria bacterium]|nr:M56 family metallopeptidase [Vicinamibacteria bacterium]
MTLYGVCVLLVIFGLLMAFFDLALLGITKSLLRRISRLAARRRTSAILISRFAPAGLAATLTAFIFIPAWWRFEPKDPGEAASSMLMALALLAFLPILRGVHRAAGIFLRTRDRLLLWRRRGRQTCVLRGSIELVEVHSSDLALCVGGYLRPTIYASSAVMNSLEPEEFAAALAHEASHAEERDPLRFLWMGSCPDFLQLFGLDEIWRRAFSTACEFAADAGASDGDPEVALDLASALLKVARLSSFRPLPRRALSDVAVSSAFSSRVDLEARVKALTNPSPETAGDDVRFRPWMLAVTVLLMGVAGALASERVHGVSEAVGRFLAP